MYKRGSGSSLSSRAVSRRLFEGSEEKITHDMLYPVQEFVWEHDSEHSDG
jgi:hypothetical protein